MMTSVDETIPSGETETAATATAGPAIDPPVERDPSPLDVHLDQFDGPLDLLLSLIRSQKIDIYDIPIAKITAQYLEHLRQAEGLNIDLGGDFVFMAATLIHIKSRLLLPRDPLTPEGEGDDPRQDLVAQLLEHEKFVQAAQMLREKRLVEENVWSNPPIHAFLDEGEEPDLAVDLFDLVKTFDTVLERAKQRPTYEVTTEDVSVASRIQFLKNLLVAEDEPVSLREVFERQPSVRALIATFLAVLELVRMRAIMLRQKKLFEEIIIRKHKMFDAVFAHEESFFDVGQEYQG